jgi:hypothetical protein
MCTRTRLNVAFFNGSLLLAAVVGGLTQSWAVFPIALVALLAANVLANEIRAGRHSNRRQHGR